MRKCYPSLLLTAFLFLSSAIYGQSVGIGTSSPNSSAQLDISSSSRGLLIPRMDSNAVKAIVSPAAGLMVYDSSRRQLLVNMGTAAAPDWENIVAKSGWSLTGNAGTGGTAVLGTTDQTPLIFSSNKLVVGSLDVSSYNVAFGYATLINGGCFQCVALGTGAQQSGANGSIAIGYEAMATNTGTANIGLGQQALENSTGSNNMAIGLAALFVNTGQNNIAFGNSASTFNGSGSNNVAVGTLAMEENITGQSNTAIGTNALQLTSNSWYNTVVGANSGQAYDNGYNNVFLGANNDVNGSGYFNVIAIGQAVTCTASSQARIGNSATNSIGGYADWTNFSDGRYKKNMQENVKGLDFIMRLRPITYNLDVTGIRTHLGQGAVKDEGTRRSISERESEVLSGFSAQEVEAAAAASGYEFSGVDKPKNANDFYGLRYGDFVVPLVKAVQEQQQQIDDLKTKVTGGVSATVTGGVSAPVTAALLAPAAATGSWNLAGNAGTNPSTNFLGTTDANDLVFRVNNQLSGRIDIGLENTFFGYQAGLSNSNSYNTVMGFEAMYKNTSGSANSVFGTGALLQNTTGFSNSAVGYNAMRQNIGGNYNTAIGNTALINTTNSWYNTVVGANSGSNYDNGYNNVFVGANNDVNGAGYYNVIAIGQGVICTASSQARFGNSATNSIGGYANWTNFSDGRYKKNMKEDVKGLDFIMRLRPITYNLDVTAIRNHLGEKAPSDEGTRRSIAEREAEVFSGFAAQEVEQAATASGYAFSGVDKPKNEKDFYGLRYGDFVVPLVKGMQEQQEMIGELQKKVAALEEQNRLLMELIKKQQ
jgi:trimeric autotransporter adhesin